MDFTISQIIITAIGSIGGLTGLVTAAVFINNVLSERRKAREERDQRRISESAEGRRLELEFSGKQNDSVRDEVWRIIAEQKIEIEKLEAEIERCEVEAAFSRPKVAKMYTNLRLMEEELNHLNMMVFDQEQTNVFMKRLANAKFYIHEQRGLLP